MSDQSARNYMNAAEKFGDKSQTVLDLPPTIVYALAAPSTPEPVRRTVFARYEAGEKIEPTAVKLIIREAKQAEQQTAKIARMKPAKRRYEATKQAKREREEVEWRAKQDASKQAASAAVEFLRDRLGPDFHQFLELMNATDAYRFAEAIKELSPTPQVRPG